MRRERALKVLLVVVGLLFVAGVYPLLMFLYEDPVLAMMLSVYVALGIFLLLAARNPSANHSLIAFTVFAIIKLGPKKYFLSMWIPIEIVPFPLKRPGGGHDDHGHGHDDHGHGHGHGDHGHGADPHADWKPCGPAAK